MNNEQSIKLANSEIFTLESNISQLLQEASQKGLKLPGRLSYALTRNHIFLTRQKSKYEFLRNKIVFDHAKKDEKGVPIVIIENDVRNYTFDDEEVVKKEIESLIDEVNAIPYYPFPSLDSYINDVHGEHSTLDLLWTILNYYSESFERQSKSTKPKKSRKAVPNE